MASSDEDNEVQLLQRFHLRQRRALNGALGSLIGNQSNKTFQAFTFEDAVDLQIERIEGAGTQLRPNQLDRVSRIENDLIKAASELKAIPPERFIEANDEEDVNTAP